jgi:autotransporter-associated beta strand protein
VYATINGPGGALFLTNTSGTVSVRQGEVNSGASATLDMRGLDTFTAYVSQILAGGENINKDVGILYLANTNYITCSASGTTAGFIVGNNPTSGSKTTRSFLGTTNVILADGGMEVPSKRMTASLAFVSSGSVAYFRNRAGTGPQDHWYIGFNNTSGTGTSCSGDVDFSLGLVDAMMNTLVVGQGETSGSSGSTATGALYFFGGSMVASNVDIGAELITVNPGNGTMTINDANGPAQFTVNGFLRLGRHVSGGNGNSGTLNVLGNGSASVTVKGNIIGGGGNSTLSFANSTLSLSGAMGATGTGQGPISSFSFSGGTLTLNLGASPNPVTAVCSVTNAALTQPITLNVLGTALSVGQFPLIQYQSISGDAFNAFTTVNLPAQVQGYLSNNTSSIDLVITNIFAPVWNGQTNGVAVGVWDINTTPDWKTTGGAALKYQQTTVPGNQVSFDDTAAGTTTVNLTTTLEPASVSVNNSAKNYTFTGSGQLSGPASLSKQGSGMLTLANSGQNNFSGPISIVGGTVQLGVANGLPTNGAVTLADAAGATLNLNGLKQTLAALSGGGADGGGNVALGSATLTISAGNSGNYAGIISGGGRVVITNSALQIFAGPNTYTGGTLVSTGTFVADNLSGSATGPGSVDVEGGTLQIGNGDTGAGFIAASTITNNGEVVFNRSDAFTFTNAISGSGGVSQQGGGAVTMAVANTYTGPTAISGGALQISNGSALGATNSTTTVANGGPPVLQLAGGITVLNPLAVNSKGGALNGTFPVVENISGSNTLAGPVQATSSGTDLVFTSDADKLTLSGGFSYASAGSHQIVRLRGAGNGEWHGSITNAGTSIVALLKHDAGTWVVTPSSTNTYTDVTSVQGGTLVMDGQVLGSSQVDVTSGATLGGTGLITAPVTIEDGATLIPGDAGIGTLTISNGLTLVGNSTVDVELSEAGGIIRSSQVNGLTNVTYSGTLQVTLDTPLSGGEIFHLFNSASYDGAFGAVNLPSLPSSLTWDTSQLGVDGTLRVQGGVVIQSVAHVGNSFQISGTGTAGQTFRVFETTNLSIAFSNWVQVGSGTFSGGGTFNFSDTGATNQQRFYRMVTP